MTKNQRNQTEQGPGASRADCDPTTHVRRTISALLAKGEPTIAQAADAVGMSVRTLQRRLLHVGLTYSHLLDEVRFETACHLLERSETSLAEIAAALGYGDPANFTRAFLRWTGKTPSVFRRRSRQGCMC